jgi:hypothetical protein
MVHPNDKPTGEIDMAYSVIGGATRQKIELDEIIESAVNELKEIEASPRTQSEKTKLFKRLAVKIKNELHEDGRVNDDAKIAMSTYSRYLTKVRYAIRATGCTHHSLKAAVATANTLPRVMKDFPEYADMLEGLRNEPAATIGALKKQILKAVKADKSNKRRSAAYDAVSAIKTDHEVLQHLLMDRVQRSDFLEDSDTALELKKNNTVQLAHANIMKMITDNLGSESYSRRAFALALASGRRAVEIIFTAGFEQTGDNTVMFDGQAKKRAGMESGAFEIFTLVPAADFMKAFKSFRNEPEVQRIHSDFAEMDKEARNTAINGRVAKTFNEAAKAIFGSNERTFKDTRAVYARVCIDTLWDKKTDEDVFVVALLGHDGYTSQQHYKQFAIDYAAPETQPAGPTFTPKSAQLTTVEHDSKELRKVAKELAGARAALEAFVAANPKRNGMLNYHNLVEEWAAANPSKQITFSALVKREKGGIGGNRNSVKDYLSVLEAELNVYNSKRGEAKASLSRIFGGAV